MPCVRLQLLTGRTVGVAKLPGLARPGRVTRQGEEASVATLAQRTSVKACMLCRGWRLTSGMLPCWIISAFNTRGRYVSHSVSDGGRALPTTMAAPEGWTANTSRTCQPLAPGLCLARWQPVCRRPTKQHVWSVQGKRGMEDGFQAQGQAQGLAERQVRAVVKPESRGVSLCTHLD